MAVLKDLIVHGRSRFLNGINANSIKADEGIFNQLIAVDLKATDATIENLTATNARVTQTLTANHISTNTWEAASIANIGGNFYISPTGEQSGSINVTIDRTAAPGTDGGTYTLTFGVPSGSSGGFGVSSTSAAYWTNNARVMATGEVSYNNSKKYPLGTCSGTISGNVTASNNNITAITIAGVKSEALDVLFTDMGVVITASGGSLAGCVGYKLKISLYERYNSVYYPIGILLTSLGRNDKKQYIDIYGGSIKSGYDAAGNVLNTGMAEPTLRIGELDGLPNIVTNGENDTKPSGWGIYTTNGFFKGKIVSNAGIIANFTINGSKLYSNNHSTYDTAVSGIYIGDDYISFGSGGVTYFNTGGTGKIGPWTLSTTYFRNGKIANATNTTVSGVYLGTDGLNISNGTAATTSYITKSAVNIGNKLTWNGTTLSVTGAINATSLSTGTKTSSTSGTGTYIDSSGNIYSGSGSANNFTVTSTGTLTATGATINGAITATSFSAYSGSTKRAEMTAQGLKIYDSDGTQICQFGSDNGAATIQLGKISGGHMYMSGTGGIQIYNSNTSSNYISVISSGVTIVGKVESNTIKSKSVIDSNGLSVYKDDMTNSVANFSSTIRLGKATENHVLINSSGIDLKYDSVSISSFSDAIRLGKLSAENLYFTSANSKGTLAFRNGTSTTCAIIGDSDSGMMTLQTGNGAYQVVMTTGSVDYAIFNNGSAELNGTLSVAKKLTAGAINIGLFSVTTETFSYTTKYGAGNQEKTTAAVTKTGYYPLGIVGFEIDQTGWVIRRCYLTDRSSGSCKVYFNIRNTTSNSYAITFKAHILWVKVTA